MAAELALAAGDHEVILRLIAITCLGAMIALCHSSGLRAQSASANGLEAMRIFVAEKDIDRVVTPAFLTVPIEELDKLLKEYVQRHSSNAEGEVGIQRATYVARWHDQMLTSRASMLQVAAGHKAPLPIGRVSVALEEPQGAPESAQLLTRQLRYLSDNELTLLPDERQQEYWFGFKAKTRRRDAGLHSIELQLPQAVVSTLLVAVPTQTVVTSDLPCAVVSDVQKLLPEGWPATALPALSADEHWFAIWLSGRDTCTLNFSPAAKLKDAGYRMLIASSQCDTQVTPAGVQVTSQFRLTSSPPGGKLRVMIEDQLHVRTISVGGVDVSDWQAIQDEGLVETDPQSRPRSRLIEFPCESPENEVTVVTVDCIGRVPLPFDGVLPRVDVDGAYVLDGRSTLTGHERMQIEDARSTAHVLATSSQNGVSQWQWQWTGKTPSTNIRLRVLPNQWTVRSLTRLEVQTDAVVASVHANLSSQHVQGNETTLKLATGWFVDSVELENAPLGVTASTSGDASELNIRWDERRSDLDVRIFLKAHYHQSTDVENLKLATTRILSMPGADQTDATIVESSGRFRLELDAELLRMRAREDELLPWQRAMLPRLGDAWIFRAGHAILPPLRLSRTRATFEAKLYTTVSEDPTQVIASYAVVCRPISGSIKQLKIQMSLPANAVAPTWSIVDPFTTNARSKLNATSSAISSSTGETTFTVDLSEDVSEEFQLQAELGLARRDAARDQSPSEVSVPLPSMRQAVSQEAVLAVPASYKFSESLPSIEILPPGLCCDHGQLVESASAPEVVALRYDTSAFAKIDLQPQAKVEKTGWAYSQVHEHWQFNAGRTLHRSSWDIANPTARVIEFMVPAAWQFQSLIVNHEEQSLAGAPQHASLNDQRLSVAVPKGNHVHVEIICSEAGLSSWFQPTIYREPKSPLSALESRSVVWFPNSRWATAEWPVASGDWASRFCPPRWWKLLSFQPGPTQPLTTVAKSEQASVDIFPDLEREQFQVTGKNGWWKLEFDESTGAPRVWSIEQSLVGSICLCLFLALCIGWLLACGAQWRRWLASCILVGAAVAFVPNSVLLPTQLIALSLMASMLVRLARAIVQKSRAVSVKRSDSLQLSRSSLPRSGVITSALWIVATIGLPMASAQPFKSGLKEKREVFGILIPVDDKYKVAGEFAYISPRLYSLLRNANENEPTTREVRIASAVYSLTITNDLVNSMNTTGDVTVELAVQAGSAEGELRLPFLRSEASLVRALLDSQSLILGDRIRQESDSIIWRVTDSERHTLRLTLRPRALVQREGRGQLSLSIPAIPTARLEIQCESLNDMREITVDAIGGVQSETFRSLSARLGPLNRLNVGWPLSANRTGPSQVQSDTWIHSRGEKIMAMCQLRLRGANSIPGTLAVTTDSNWIPVGQDWEDFRPVSTEGISSAGRTTYNVEKLEDRDNDELTLKVLMLPRDESSSSLSIPFLTFQQPLVTVSRTLAISHTDSPLWKMTGNEWPPLLSSQASQIWNGTRLGEQPSLWKVPSGSLQATLQRITPPAAPTVDEVTEVQLQMPETKMKYVARWSTPLVGQPAVRFQIPAGLRVDSVLVDALAANYSIHKMPAPSTASELVVFIDSRVNGNQSIHLQLSSATRLNRPFRLSRPLAIESEIRSSVVQIFRGVELAGTHAVVDNSELELTSLDVRDSKLLQELQSPVGRLELDDRWRESPELPLEFTLTRAPAARPGRAVMRFIRSDQGWRGQLDAMVETKSGELNHVFFDVPRSLENSLKEPLESNAPIKLWLSADSNRMLMSVLPARDSGNQAHISFAFRLPSSAVSQAINVPDIRLLGVTSPRPALAFPTELSGEAVRWSGIGRRLPEVWIKNMQNERLDLSTFDLFEPVDNQSQAVWTVQEQKEKDAELLMTIIELSPANPGSSFTRSDSASQPVTKRGEICYWIEPHNRPFLDIDLPESIQLVGVETNDRPTNWVTVSNDRIRILLQPSYLPSRLRLLVRWSDSAGQATSVEASAELTLPKPDALVSGPILIRQARQASGIAARPEPSRRVANARAIAAETVESMQAQRWANTLIRSAPVAAGRGQDELTAWLPSWDPMWLGLKNSSPVTVRRQAISSRSSSTSEQPDGEVQLTVAEFWSEFLKQHTLVPNTTNRDTTNRDTTSDSSVNWSLAEMRTIDEYQWQQISATADANLPQLLLEPSSNVTDSMLLGRWSIGLAWIILGIAVWLVCTGRLRNYFVAVGELLWPLWLGLAIASAALLPVLWPALVIAAGLVVVLVRRYRQLRRDRHFVLMPKTVR